jgi:circadian clock protein KaiC
VVTGAVSSAANAPPKELPKAPSGISGLDEITGGGLPRGRASLICGGPGCGKTLMSIEFLMRGITQFDEPGVFMAFEETREELAANVASLGFDLPQLEAEGKLAIDYVRVERSEIQETGEYDLEGLFVRLQLAIDSVGAKRVVLDTLESLFSGLPNEAILRSEIRRLFRWLKDRGMTVVVTAEQGEGTLTRQGLEEYVSDCVIFLDHRVIEQNSTRRLRVVKYRGTTHATNEFPFLIDQHGVAILPITSIGLEHKVSTDRISTGIPRMDEMLGGTGYYKGSTVLASGTAGTGKTTLAAALARDACARGEKCIYFAYEESPDQLARNMRSVGIELGPHIRSGQLRFVASRPTEHGLEMHLVTMHKLVTEFEPAVVILDPISNLTAVGQVNEARAMLTRVIDFLKSHSITAMMTSLTRGSEDIEVTELAVSSLVDTWILLGIVRNAGERNRTLSIIKSRGTPHSNQAAEFIISNDGLLLLDTYVGPTGVLTGSARIAREAEDQRAFVAAEEEINRKRQLREHRHRVVEAQIASLREQLAADDAELQRALEEDLRRRERLTLDRETMAKSRRAFSGPEKKSSSRRRG